MLSSHHGGVARTRAPDSNERFRFLFRYCMALYFALKSMLTSYYVTYVYVLLLNNTIRTIVPDVLVANNYR